MSMTEYEFEPIQGLPGKLPSGESILWQGMPNWKSFAKNVFHIKKVVFYFTLLIAIQALVGIYAQQSYIVILNGAVWLLMLMLITVGILTMLAWLYSRSTIYTVTNVRLIIRFGVAIPMIVNFPWGKVSQADLKVYADRSGDIPLTLNESEKVSYLLMWPNVRPFHFSQVQPMMRNVPNAEQVAKLIASVVSDKKQVTNLVENVELKPSDRATDSVSAGTNGLLGT